MFKIFTSSAYFVQNLRSFVKTQALKRPEKGLYCQILYARGPRKTTFEKGFVQSSRCLLVEGIINGVMSYLEKKRGKS
jgi:hypothetical protein